MSTVPGERLWTDDDYEQAARAYQASLTPEDVMEASRQFIQRKITLESFDALRCSLPHFHFFAEMLVQYQFEGEPCRVVPDCMVVLGDLPDRVRSSYQPQREQPLFWTLEFVSHDNWEQDYGPKRERYERELKVPWYLMYDPEEPNPFLLTLYRLTGEGGYQIVSPNSAGRMEIPDLDLEVGVLSGWGRFWYRGQLLPVTEELVRESANLRHRVQQQDQQLEQQSQHLEMMAQLLRPIVEERARRANRQDILDALPATADPDTFRRWLEELA